MSGQQTILRARRERVGKTSLSQFIVRWPYLSHLPTIFFAAAGIPPSIRQTRKKKSKSLAIRQAQRLSCREALRGHLERVALSERRCLVLTPSSCE